MIREDINYFQAYVRILRNESTLTVLCTTLDREDSIPILLEDSIPIAFPKALPSPSAGFPSLELEGAEVGQDSPTGSTQCLKRVLQRFSIISRASQYDDIRSKP